MSLCKHFAGLPAARRLARLGLVAVVLPCVVALSLTTVAAAADVALERSDTEAVTLRVRVADLEITPVMEAGQPFDELTFAGARFVAEPGAPNVPVLRQLVAVPDCRDIAVSGRVIAENWRDGVQVAPAREFDEFGDLAPLQPRPDLYGNAAEYPGQPVRLVSVGQIRDQRVALVEIQPVQFVAANQRIRVIEEIEITLTFTGSAGPLRREAGPMQGALEAALVNGSGPSSDRPAMQKGMGSVTWVAGNGLPAVINGVNSCQADYLILAGAGLPATPITQLAQKRAQFNGFHVAIVTLDQIDTDPDTQDTPDQIKELIQTVYDDATAGNMADGHLGYVLLVGDAWDAQENCLLPGYYGYWHENASDSWYGFVAGDDDFADVFVGRLPVNNHPMLGGSPQLANIVNKILGYANDTSGDNENLMFTGDLTDISAPDFDEIIDEILPDYVQTTVLHRADYPSGDVFSGVIADAINDLDPWLVAGYGHGNPMYYGDTFYPEDFCHLTNDKYPLFLMAGCGLGRFDLTADDGFACLQEGVVDPCDAIAEALVVTPAGAIGTLAFSWGGVSVTNAQNAFYGLYEGIFQRNAFGLGDILTSIQWYYPFDQISHHLTLFGDPALNLVWEEGARFEYDLRVRPRNLTFAGHDGLYVNSEEPAILEIAIDNLGDDTAYRVRCEVWDGHPDDAGSTQLGTVYVAEIPGYEGSVTATFDLGLLEPGEHEVWVRVPPSYFSWEMTDLNNTAGITYLAGPLVPGFPTDIGAVNRKSLAVGNLATLVPGKEILVNHEDALICVAADGTELWRRTLTSGGSFNTPCVAEVYQDGLLHCVVNEIDQLLVLNGESGATIQAIPLGAMLVAGQDQALQVADLIPGDGSLEVVTFGFRMADPVAMVVEAFTLYEHAGTYRRWTHVLDTTVLNGQLAVGDADADGDLEIVAITEQPTVWLNDITILQPSPLVDGPPPTAIVTQLTALSGSNKELAIFKTGSGASPLDILATGGQTPPQVSRIAIDGAVIYDDGPALPVKPHFTCADMEGDGDFDIVVTSGNHLKLIRADRSDWNDNIPIEIDGSFRSAPMTADLDADGDLDVVALYAEGGNLHLQVYDERLNPVGTPQSFWGEGDLYQQFALADVDQDGRFEAVFLHKDGWLYAVPVGTDAGRSGWAQTYADAPQTNRAPLAVQVSLERDDRPVPDTPVALVSGLGGASPNPFNPMTTIQFTVGGTGGHVDLAVFDLRGRRITTLRTGHLEPGAHEVTWPGTDDAGRRVSTGIYLVRLQAGETLETRKVLLAK